VSYYAPTACQYYAPVRVYRRPRGYCRPAGYYGAPVAYGRPWRRPRAYGYYAGPRRYARPYYRASFYGRPYRAYPRGPAYRARGWRRW
jgi:hypothetical protein